MIFWDCLGTTIEIKRSTSPQPKATESRIEHVGRAGMGKHDSSVPLGISAYQIPSVTPLLRPSGKMSIFASAQPLRFFIVGFSCDEYRFWSTISGQRPCPKAYKQNPSLENQGSHARDFMKQSSGILTFMFEL